MEKTDDSNLNGLLEEALDDLLSNNEPTKHSKPETINNESNDSKQLDTTTGVGSSKTTKKEKKKSKTGNSSAGTSSSKFKPNVNLDEFDEEQMNKFFENMSAQLKAELPRIDPEEAKAKINESVPQIFDLMQNLLSKELLYPALKDLSPKFEEWLEKNKESLSQGDLDRYKKQKSIIDEIIEVFDDESLGSQQVFERNLDLMETMQSLGAPPEELTVPQEIGRCSVM